MPQQQQQSSPWATCREVAEHYRVTERTVQRWVKAGTMPGVLVGGSIRIPQWVMASDVLVRKAAA